VFPFDRLSDDAKRSLALAQEEAAALRTEYIGTEHLLLGLLRLGSGSAHRALLVLGVDAARVRYVIERAIRQRHAPRDPPAPTARVQRVLETAYAESVRMGMSSVRSAHILMGLASEGTGMAALVLQDLGGTSENVVQAAERQML
jgi:ATP-dependent Clp protease ATP-binding subunit ClpC